MPEGNDLNEIMILLENIDNNVYTSMQGIVRSFDRLEKYIQERNL